MREITFEIEQIRAIALAAIEDSPGGWWTDLAFQQGGTFAAFSKPDRDFITSVTPDVVLALLAIAEREAGNHIYWKMAGSQSGRDDRSALRRA